MVGFLGVGCCDMGLGAARLAAPPLSPLSSPGFLSGAPVELPPAPLLFFSLSGCLVVADGLDFSMADLSVDDFSVEDEDDFSVDDFGSSFDEGLVTFCEDDDEDDDDLTSDLLGWLDGETFGMVLSAPELTEEEEEEEEADFDDGVDEVEEPVEGVEAEEEDAVDDLGIDGVTVLVCGVVGADVLVVLVFDDLLLLGVVDVLLADSEDLPTGVVDLLLTLLLAGVADLLLRDEINAFVVGDLLGSIVDDLLTGVDSLLDSVDGR